MKLYHVSLLAACATARFIETVEIDNVVLDPVEDLFLVETSPGEREWVTEDQKWEMRRVSFAVLYDLCPRR